MLCNFLWKYIERSNFQFGEEGTIEVDGGELITERSLTLVTEARSKI